MCCESLGNFTNFFSINSISRARKEVLEKKVSKVTLDLVTDCASVRYKGSFSEKSYPKSYPP